VRIFNPMNSMLITLRMLRKSFREVDANADKVSMLMRKYYNFAQDLYDNNDGDPECYNYGLMECGNQWERDGFMMGWESRKICDLDGRQRSFVGTDYEFTEDFRNDRPYP
jgi:hypothetical protein